MYEELIQRLKRCNQFKCNGCDYENVISCRVKLNAEASNAIEELSKERKLGCWRHYEGNLTCSECAVTIYDDIMSLLGDDVPRFCPNCGAKMEVPTDV